MSENEKPAWTWLWDEQTQSWQPPTPYPTRQGIYRWNDWDRRWDRLGDSSTYEVKNANNKDTNNY